MAASASTMHGCTLARQSCTPPLARVRAARRRGAHVDVNEPRAPAVMPRVPLEAHTALLVADDRANDTCSGVGNGDCGLRAKVMTLGPWVGVATSWATVGIGLWWAMSALYFGNNTVRCATFIPVADGWSPEARALESGLGALPILLRNFFVVWLLWKVCRKFSGFEDDGAHVVRAMLVGRGSTLGAAPKAGWDAIVGSRSSEEGGGAQSTWTQAREARRLTQQQAVASASAKALCWHTSQPLVYLVVLRIYSCYIASLGNVQCHLATVVAAREVIYLASIALGIWQSPVFLLLDPVTAWNEASSWLEGTVRIAMYVLTPHNYVAFSLANRLRAWRRTFLGLAAIQIVADFASCFALATLMAGGIRAQNDTPTALIIGYAITSFGFLLFFGPLSAASSLREGMDRSKSRWIRCVLTVAGISLVLALSYIVLLLVLLISGTDVFCKGWTFQSDPCNGHGECYAATQCRCELGFGPELSYDGEPLCSRGHSPCTGFQLQRALAAGDNTCCFGHGNITAGERCSCDPGFGPESIDDLSDYQQADGMRQTLGEPLCTRHIVCTAEKLRYAVTKHEEVACGGPHFPGSRLLTPEWGEALTHWTNDSVPEAEWTLCFSSFPESRHGQGGWECDAAAFHLQCDQYNATVSVVHTGVETTSQGMVGNYTYGGFAAGSWNMSVCCEDPRNECGREEYPPAYVYYCWDQSTSQDFLFDLWMPGRGGGARPQRFLPTGANAHYQYVGPEQWPGWGTHDLRMGTLNVGPHQGADNGCLGHYAECGLGGTYGGPANSDLCEGTRTLIDGFEVWRPACTTCGGHGTCDHSTRVCACFAGYTLANPATCVLDA
eukprot:COSAG02_NODE_297_length_25355_cov_78.632998_10_plen_838_part_00